MRNANGNPEKVGRLDPTSGEPAEAAYAPRSPAPGAPGGTGARGGPPGLRALLALSAVFLTGCLTTSFPRTPREGGPAWEEITTDHFVIDTDLEPAQADAVARQLETMRNVLVQAFFRRPPKVSPPLRVFALRYDEYSHFDRAAIGRYFNKVVYRPLLLTSPGSLWGSHESDVRKHELAHAVASLYIEFGRQPRWFAEGLAKYLETLTYDEATGRVEIGQKPQDYEYLQVALEREPDRIYFDDLWRWDARDPGTEKEMSQLYEVSWAVVHYLIDDRPGELARYEEALAAGRDAREQWKAIFPDLDRDGLATAVKRYLRFLRFNVTTANVPVVPAAAPRRRALDEADVLGLRALLYLALQPGSRRSVDASKALASQALDASFRINAASFWAHQVAYAYLGKLPDDIAVARRALAGHEDDWEAWMWYADVLVADHGSLEEARTAMRKAIDLAPGVSVPLARAATIEAGAGNWSASLDLAEQAIDAPPYSLDAALAFVTALAETHHCVEAMNTVETVRRRMPEVPDGANRVFLDVQAKCAR